MNTADIPEEKQMDSKKNGTNGGKHRPRAVASMTFTEFMMDLMQSYSQPSKPTVTRKHTKARKHRSKRTAPR